MICPECGSGNLCYDKKGFGSGKEAAGVLLIGSPVGGMIGRNKTIIRCLNCDKRWTLDQFMGATNPAEESRVDKSVFGTCSPVVAWIIVCIIAALVAFAILVGVTADATR